MYESGSTQQQHEDVNDYRDVDFTWIPTNALRTTARYVYPVCNRTVQIMEAIGGVIVNTFGLNQSRFQYAVDEYNRRERVRIEKEQMVYQKERNRILEAARQGLDNDTYGGGEDEEDESEANRRYCPPMPPLVSERVPLQREHSDRLEDDDVPA
ncbi:Hypothetical protein, putative [Bodo saltans]|uniref:Uncharacterized protein n=1 Tax=Bodo saltans TaxID=75058 RepID=A0A0S4JFK9_BODSA|nr:Hypothetical protein, putative [Bodo saltans]|eukprot:CUG90205.1 Hypothetical protein, putative [Bodo saltans]